MGDRRLVVALLALLLVAGVALLVPQQAHAVCPTCPPAPGGGGGGEKQKRPTPTDTKAPPPTSTSAPAVLPALLVPPASLTPSPQPTETGVQPGPLQGVGGGPAGPQNPTGGPGQFNLPEPLSLILGSVLLAGILFGLLLPAVRKQFGPAIGSSPNFQDGSDKMGAQPHMLDDGSDRMGAQPHMQDGSDAMGAQPHMQDGSDAMGAQPHMQDGSDAMGAQPHMDGSASMGSPAAAYPPDPGLGDLPSSIGNPDF